MSPFDQCPRCGWPSEAVEGINDSCACGRPARWWCDWKMPNREHGLCNKPVCEEHALKVAPMKHLCPEHQVLYQEWEKRKKEKAKVDDEKWRAIKA